jgi:hypothetical protein
VRRGTMVALETSDSFTSFLKSKGIIISPGFEEAVFYCDIDETKALEQLYAIGDFHINTMGYKAIVERNFENRTGKLIEQYKFYLKKTKRLFKVISEKGAENKFEELLLACGNDFINSAEVSLKDLNKSGYIDIIKRSMKRGEICLENTDFSNIRRREQLEVVNINSCSYNIVEIDAFNFLSKLKRKDVKLDYSYLIEQFCKYEGLNGESDEFITALLRYPYNFMRCCNRYKDNKKNWTIDEYVMRMNKAMIKDEEVFL